MKVNCIHAFYNVFMGSNQLSLLDLFAKHTNKQFLAKGEVALFLNNQWSACKLLVTPSMLVYYRKENVITLDDIKRIPTLIGGPRLIFEKALEERLEARFEADFGKKMKRLKAVAST